jgi:hypothetical protein
MDLSALIGVYLRLKVFLPNDPEEIVENKTPDLSGSPETPCWASPFYGGPSCAHFATTSQK